MSEPGLLVGFGSKSVHASNPQLFECLWRRVLVQFSLSSLQDFWSKAVELSGHTNMFQFKLGVEELTKLYIRWKPRVLRCWNGRLQGRLTASSIDSISFQSATGDLPDLKTQGIPGGATRRRISRQMHHVEECQDGKLAVSLNQKSCQKEGKQAQETTYHEKERGTNPQRPLDRIIGIEFWHTRSHPTTRVKRGYACTKLRIALKYIVQSQ